MQAQLWTGGAAIGSGDAARGSEAGSCELQEEPRVIDVENHPRGALGDSLLVDCDECIMKASAACEHCVVAVILDGHHGLAGERDTLAKGVSTVRSPGETSSSLSAHSPQQAYGNRASQPGSGGSHKVMIMEADEFRAIDMLARAGLVPALRHVRRAG
ncbi:MAG: hypothetical protein M1115_11070 [Actinobacteria bacterium]|nr:hypothetical protein [Actinomycetota bacterium]